MIRVRGGHWFGFGVCLLLAEDARRNVAEGFMGALLVVGCHPFVDALADFAEGGEQVRIDDLAPEGPVEAFDTDVLRGLAGRGASMLGLGAC